MIRKAVKADLDGIMEIYEAAKKFMCENGNPTQWPKGYPSPELISEDIENGCQYVICAEDSVIHACFGLFVGEDATYSYIEGKWIDDSPYAAIHRVASDGKLKGVFHSAFEFASGMHSHIRIDTHDDNTVMQNAILKCGFEYCGTIYAENGTPRRAYEWTRQ